MVRMNVNILPAKWAISRNDVFLMMLLVCIRQNVLSVKPVIFEK
jgi:hypothetical protein